jgi:hypothetical protein
MSRCPDTDTILTIGDALHWDVQEGLRHLQTCEDCRSQIDVLRLAHAGFADAEAVAPAVLQSVSGAVATAAARDRERRRTTDVLAQWIEPILAGVTALITVSSSRVPIDSVGAAAAAFAIGIALFFAGRAAISRAGLA